MLTVCSLQSGSSGNCSYVASATTKLLVDAGISGVKIKDRLAELDVDIYDIDGVLITHDHSDHIGNASVLGSRYRLPIYIMKACHDARFDRLRRIKTMEYFDHDESFGIGDIDITAVPLPHDATATCGFTFHHNDASFGIFTDLGHTPEELAEHINDLDGLLFETNHDLNMLLSGDYPQALKDRVSGPRGHISNTQAADFLHAHLSSRTRTLFLAHLSQDNNSPEIALRTLQDKLASRSDLAELEYVLTYRYKATSKYEIRQQIQV